jgi:hypothetical protein
MNRQERIAKRKESQVDRGTVADKQLVNSMKALISKGRASDIAKVVYESMREAFNVKSKGPDGVDYSGALWSGVQSSLKKLL